MVIRIEKILVLVDFVIFRDNEDWRGFLLIENAETCGDDIKNQIPFKRTVNRPLASTAFRAEGLNRALSSVAVNHAIGVVPVVFTHWYGS